MDSLLAEELPKESSDHGSKGTFPPEFVEMRVVKALGMKTCLVVRQY